VKVDFKPMENILSRFYLNRRIILIIVLISTIVLLCVLNQFSSSGIPQPLAGSVGISATLTRTLQGPPSGPTTAVDEVFRLWHLEATTEQIEAATSGDQIYDGLKWNTVEPSRLKKTLEFLKRSDTYDKFQPYISDMLNDPNLRCAYREYGTYPNGDISYVAMWVCVPRLHKIAYLSCPD
jgi:hypothetical protein